MLKKTFALALLLCLSLMTPSAEAGILIRSGDTCICIGSPAFCDGKCEASAQKAQADLSSSNLTFVGQGGTPLDVDGIEVLDVMGSDGNYYGTVIASAGGTVVYEGSGDLGTMTVIDRDRGSVNTLAEIASLSTCN